MKRVIKSNEINGFLSAQQKSANSLTFCGELPKNVKINNIRLIGEVKVNGLKLTNPIVENLDGAMVQHHKDSEDGAIATVYFADGVPEELLYVIQNYILTDFEIDCIEVCPCCGK
jgi:hypothetical protein